MLVFVAKIQDASFPPTRKKHTITNSMHTILLKIKYNYRKVGSEKQSGFNFKPIFIYFLILKIISKYYVSCLFKSFSWNE